MIILHIIKQLLPSLLILLQDPIYIETEGILLELTVSSCPSHITKLLNTGVDLDFLLMNVLLDPSLIVISLVEIICTRQSLMLGLLLFNIIFRLLHIN